MKRNSPRNVPLLTTDEAAEAFLAQDLSELDFSQFKPAPFVLEEGEEELRLRLPKALLDAARALTEG